MPDVTAWMCVVIAPLPSLFNRIRKAYTTDSFFGEFESGSEHSVEDGLREVGLDLNAV